MSELEGLYDGREQTLVKHEVLRRYLQRFAYKIGSWRESITYVDCYSGPWNERSEQFADTSFRIAIEQLRAAKRELGKDIRLRCFFIERDRAAFQKLSAFVSQIDDIEIETRNADFANSVGEILQFVRADRMTFPFFLIDPKGWSIPIEVIRPLLEHTPCEVLITFMLEFIRRFVDHPEDGLQQTYDLLYGEKDVAKIFSNFQGDERDDLLLNEYLVRVKRIGKFDFASSSLVLHPQKARKHFNLVYLTRHPKGIEVFKEAEKAAMREMESARAQAAKRQRESSGQLDLLSAEDLYDNTYFNGLRERALSAMSKRLLKIIEDAISISYDELWAAGLESPLIWPTDISEQVRQWASQKIVVVEGLAERERIPKVSSNHRVTFASKDGRVQ